MKREKIISMILLGVLFLIPIVFADDPNILTESTGFSLTARGGIICETNRTQWINYSDPINLIIRNSFGDNPNCNNTDGINSLTGESDTACCPVHYSCSKTELIDPIWSTQQYQCQFNAKTYCQDFYEDANSCTNNGAGNTAHAERTVLDTPSMGICGRSRSWSEERNSQTYECYNVTVCKCKWNSTVNTCGVNQNVTKECYDTTGTHDSDMPVGICNWEVTSSEDHCNDGGGYKRFIWKGTPSVGYTDPACTDNVIQQVDCSSIVMMNFFDETCFAICVFLVLVIYLIQFISKKK